MVIEQVFVSNRKEVLMTPAYEHTTMGRTYEALHEWWEQESQRGVWSAMGARWGSHPSWTSPSDREDWHKNWGELLNYHTTAHIRTVNSNGVASNRLRVRVTHPDTARLELVKSVTGGSLERPDGPRTVCRLEIETLAAFQALKAGRLYVDPANMGLIEVLTAAMRFYEHVPDRGTTATDPQRAGQEYWRDHLDKLIASYSTSRIGSHDCFEGIRRAGRRDWAVEPVSKPDFGPFT
jgi:hypothetical protein